MSPDFLVLILTHRKKGDLGQMINLARTIGCGFEVVEIPDPKDFDRSRALLDDKVRSISGGVALLTAERVLSRIALRVRDDHPDTCRVVSINRPGYRSERFDLIVTCPHYAVTGLRNVAEYPLTLNLIPADEMRRSAAALPAPLADVPSPLTVVLVGGETKVERFGPEDIRELVELSRAEATAHDASVVFVTSPRTPAAVTDGLARMAGDRIHVSLWSKDRPSTLSGLLGRADRIVVTSDSASMATEAILTGKPTLVYVLPARRSVKETARTTALRVMSRLPGLGARLVGDVFEPRADRTLFFGPLERTGVVRRYDDRAPFLWSPAAIESPLEDAAERVRGLFRR